MRALPINFWLANFSIFKRKVIDNEQKPITDKTRTKWTVERDQCKCIFIPGITMRSVFLFLPARPFFFRNLETEEVGLSLPFPAVFISRRQWLVALGSSTLPVVQVSTRRHLQTSPSIPGVSAWIRLIRCWLNSRFGGNYVCWHSSTVGIIFFRGLFSLPGLVVSFDHRIPPFIF